MAPLVLLKHLKEVILAVEIEDLLAFCNCGAYAGGGQAAAEAVSCAADTLGEGALRDELNLKLARNVLLLRNGVETDVSGEQLFDLVIDDHSAQTLVGHAAGNADSGDVLNTLLDEAGYYLFCGDLAMPVGKEDSLSVFESC